MVFSHEGGKSVPCYPGTVPGVPGNTETVAMTGFQGVVAMLPG